MPQRETRAFREKKKRRTTQGKGAAWAAWATTIVEAILVEEKQQASVRDVGTSVAPPPRGKGSSRRLLPRVARRPASRAPATTRVRRARGCCVVDGQAVERRCILCLHVRARKRPMMSPGRSQDIIVDVVPKDGAKTMMIGRGAGTGGGRGGLGPRRKPGVPVRRWSTLVLGASSAQQRQRV
jgi:hypothetical protein